MAKLTSVRSRCHYGKKVSSFLNFSEAVFNSTSHDNLGILQKGAGSNLYCILEDLEYIYQQWSTFFQTDDMISTWGYFYPLYSKPDVLIHSYHNWYFSSLTCFKMEFWGSYVSSASSKLLMYSYEYRPFWISKQKFSLQPQNPLVWSKSFSALFRLILGSFLLSISYTPAMHLTS